MPRVPVPDGTARDTWREQVTMVCASACGGSPCRGAHAKDDYEVESRQEGFPDILGTATCALAKATLGSARAEVGRRLARRYALKSRPRPISTSAFERS